MSSSTSQQTVADQGPAEMVHPVTTQKKSLNDYCNPDREENSVQPSETSEIYDRRNSYRDTLALEFPAKMLAVEAMYSRIDQADKKNYFSKLKNCRSWAMFQRNEETGKVKVTSEHCGLRWCPLCAKSRQGRIMNEVTNWFKGVYKPVLLTLTLKHSPAPLKHQIYYLYKDFKKLRNRKIFRKASQGGIWFFHIKRSKSDGLWHPHLHCLMDSDFIPKVPLSKVWSQITGGSYIVHLKTVTNPRNSVSHAARYSAEPCDMAELSESDATEVFYALHGKRLAGTWGTAKCINLRKPKAEDKESWKFIGTWNEVCELMEDDPRAKAIMTAYVYESELDESITLAPPVETVEFKKWLPPPRLFFQKSFKFAY